MTENKEVRRSRMIYEDGHFILIQESNIKGINASCVMPWYQITKFFNDLFAKEGRYLPPPPGPKD